MKIHNILFGFALAALTACHSADNAARFAATRHLAEPATAEFRAMRTNTEGVTCGEVRSSEAGQPGPYRKFIFFAHTGHAIMEPESPAVPAGSDAAFEAQAVLTKFETRYATDCR